MVNVIGIDRIVFTTDYPFGNMRAARQFFERMPINPADKEKIAHLNAERLLRLPNQGPAEARLTGARSATANLSAQGSCQLRLTRVGMGLYGNR